MTFFSFSMTRCLQSQLNENGCVLACGHIVHCGRETFGSWPHRIKSGSTKTDATCVQLTCFFFLVSGTPPMGPHHPQYLCTARLDIVWQTANMLPYHNGWEDHELKQILFSLRVGLSTSVKLIQKCPWWPAQSCVSKVIPNESKLTIKTNHQSFNILYRKFLNFSLII